MSGEVSPTRLLTAVEVAELSGLSRSSVYELWSSGRLPSVSVAGSPRMTVAQWEDYIASTTRPADAAPSGLRSVS